MRYMHPHLRSSELLSVLVLLNLALWTVTGAGAQKIEGLSATWIGEPAAGETGRLAVNWTGTPGAELGVWADFDGDGSFGGAAERIVEGAALEEGIEIFDLRVPPEALIDQRTRMRIRLRKAGEMEEREIVQKLLERSAACAWDTGFAARGPADAVEALAVYDDGTGPALYVGGEFIAIGTYMIRYIAKWDGAEWYPVGQSSNGRVYAMAVYDDGRGAALYVSQADHIVRWDGSSWTSLGSVDSPVKTLAVYDGGGGAALYGGGGFTTMGGIEANHVAKWDGNNWLSLGSGLNNSVESLVVHDDGSGPALFAGGEFTAAGGIATNRIAKWDGNSWSPLGSGMNDNINTLTVFDDGSGAMLHAGGFFTSAGGAAASHIAKWDGASWSPLGSGTDGWVKSMAVHDGSSGPELFASGFFTMAGGVAANRIAKWNGESWSPLGPGLSGAASTLATFDDGNGPSLFVGGSIGLAGDVVVSNLAKWDGSAWSALKDEDGNGLNSRARALTVFDDGGGSALYAGGFFTTAGGIAANRIAKWNGSRWSPLGSGMGPSDYSVVSALAVYDDGGGSALYAGGDFTTAGDVAASNLAKWDGDSWSPLGSGVDRMVDALAVYDDGRGPALYAGGSFTIAGGVAANRVARWDGTSWSPLGSGIDIHTVKALAVYDDGSGPALYAGGDFTTAGGIVANRIAKWDGTNWTPLGMGMNDDVGALAVYDAGSGPMLYAGGDFTTAGGIAANRIARWDGARWTPLGSGVNHSVTSLAAYDGLYAGGNFSYAGGVATAGLAKWDGQTWIPFSLGRYGWLVMGLAMYDDGGGPALYAGGGFPTAGHHPSNYIAKWACPTAPDLAISKTNHRTEVSAGGTTTYTITVTNPTLFDASSALLTDEFPPHLSCSWTSIANGGASGNAAGSGAVLRDTLDLPAGSSITYNIPCQIDPGATGELANIATISAPEDIHLDNNVAIDTDSIIRLSDLAITLTNGIDEVIAGGTVTYSLVATNHGPSDAATVTLSADLPSALAGCRWRGIADGGASDPTPGAGNALNENLTMPADSSVSYLITCAVPAAVSGTLVSTAIATTPADPDATNNTAIDSDPIVTRLTAQTVILTHFLRMQSELALTAAELESLLERLQAFADHPSVRGLVVDLGYASDLHGLYSAWDADVDDGSSDPRLANRILFGCHDPFPNDCPTEKQGIHDVVREKLATHPDVSYLMLIGDDRIIPMARVRDLTRFPSEKDYTPLTQDNFLPGLTADNTTVGQAAARDCYLSDDLLGVRGPVDTEKLDFLIDFDGSLIADLAVGRLVESPQEILQSLDGYLTKEGLLDLTALEPDHRVLITGYDFLIDSGKEICRRWKNVFGQSPQCPDENLAPVDGELLSRTWSLSTAAERAGTLLDHLSGQGLGSYGLINLNGHATHYEEGVPGKNPEDIQGLDTSAIDTLELAGSVIYAVGCHGGLPVAGNEATVEDHPLDLPQTFLRRGALAYAANSGFGWGLLHGSGYSERLMEIFTQELSRGGTVTIGDAVLTAKERYFLEDPRFDRYDVKTSLQWTLFGFPMAAVRTGLVTASPGLAEDESIPVEGSVLTNASGEPNPDHLVSVGKPFGFTAADLFVKNTALGETVEADVEGCPDPSGCFYTLNGLATGEGDLPIEPFFIEDSRLSGTSQHGILWQGGRYEEEQGWIPVFARPTSNGGPLAIPGSLPRKTFIRPRSRRRPGSLTDPNCRPTDTEPNVLVFTPAELLFDDNLDPTIHRLHREVDLEIFYYNNPNDNSNCDRTGPQLEEGPYHDFDGSKVRWAVPASDEGGVWRVVVVWDDENDDRWAPLELVYDASTDRWRGELALPPGMDRLTYFLQAVDTRGNVSWAEFVPAVSPESGIDPELPLLLEAVAGSDLIFRDGFETGDRSRWSSFP